MLAVFIENYFLVFFENEGRYEERGRMNEIECTEPQRKQGRESMKEMEGLIKNPVCGNLPIFNSLGFTEEK